MPYIFSKIQYGIEVYGQASTKKSANSTKPSFKNKTQHEELNLLLVEAIYKLGVLKFLYINRQQNNLFPNCISQFYIENASIHSHNTRQLCNKFGQRRIIYQGTFPWNSIPAELRSFHLKTISKKIKQNFISKY